MPLSVRRASPDDAAQIAAVHVASWRSAYSAQMPTEALDALSVDDRAVAWRTALMLPTSDTTFVAEADGDIAGFATVGLPQHAGDRLPGWAEVLTIYVADDVAGRGIGRALMRAAEAEMARNGAATGILWVLDTNEAAYRFYESVGWTADAETRPHIVGGVELTVVRFRKELEG